MDGTAGRGWCRLVVGITLGLALGLVLGAQSPGTSGSSELAHRRAVARFSEETAQERSSSQSYPVSHQRIGKHAANIHTGHRGNEGRPVEEARLGIKLSWSLTRAAGVLSPV